MFNDIIKEKEEFTRMELAMIYTIKTLNELVDKGLVENKIFEVSESGMELIKDFKPTDDELKQCVVVLSSPEFCEDTDD